MAEGGQRSAKRPRLNDDRPFDGENDDEAFDDEEVDETFVPEEDAETCDDDDYDDEHSENIGGHIIKHSSKNPNTCELQAMHIPAREKHDAARSRIKPSSLQSQDTTSAGRGEAGSQAHTSPSSEWKRAPAEGEQPAFGTRSSESKRRYKCDYCSKSYTQSHNLKYHMKNHPRGHDKSAPGPDRNAEAKVEFSSNPMDVVRGWAGEDEAEAAKILVEFTLAQVGTVTTVSPQAVCPQRRSPDSTRVACLYCPERRRCFIPVLDVIAILGARLRVSFTAAQRRAVGSTIRSYADTRAESCFIVHGQDALFELVFQEPYDRKPLTRGNRVWLLPWALLQSCIVHLFDKYASPEPKRQQRESEWAELVKFALSKSEGNRPVTYKEIADCVERHIPRYNNESTVDRIRVAMARVLKKERKSSNAIFVKTTNEAGRPSLSLVSGHDPRDAIKMVTTRYIQAESIASEKWPTKTQPKSATRPAPGSNAHLHERVDEGRRTRSVCGNSVSLSPTNTLVNDSSRTVRTPNPGWGSGQMPAQVNGTSRNNLPTSQLLKTIEDCVDRLQGQISPNRAGLENHTREFRSVGEAVADTRNDRRRMAEVIDSLRRGLENRSPAGSTPPRSEIPDETLEAFLNQLQCAIRKANEVDELKAQLELLRRRVGRSRNVESSPATGYPGSALQAPTIQSAALQRSAMPPVVRAPQSAPYTGERHGNTSPYFPQVTTTGHETTSTSLANGIPTCQDPIYLFPHVAISPGHPMHITRSGSVSTSEKSQEPDVTG